MRGPEKPGTARRRRRHDAVRGFAVVAATVGLFACASGGTGVSRNVITGAQIEEAGLVPFTAWEAVEQLRPNWLRSRTSTITSGRIYAVVFVDGARYGGLDTLRSLPVANVEEMRYLSAQDAMTRYGSGYLGGVIEVIHRR